MAQEYFRSEGVYLKKRFAVEIGLSTKKVYKFDLGSMNPPMLVECKSHTWTKSLNVPSAKITVWTEAMYYFHLASKKYRKVLFVLRDYNNKKKETLAEYYIRNHRHLVPEGVKIFEFNSSNCEVVRVHPNTL